MKLRYSDSRLIGSGGFGEVYRATDSQLGGYVALKLLSLEALRSEEFVGRFRREIRIHRELSDLDGVLTVLDDGELFGRPYYSSTFHEAGALDHLISSGLGSNALALLLGGVARTLAEAHERGILHRDIKPSNLLVNSDGRLVVADFGVGWIQDDRTTTTGFVGSPRYAAPEVMEGGTALSDGRSDVYSLARVGLECVGGGAPTPFVVGGGVGSDFRAILERGAAPEPSERFQTMAEFADALDAVCRAFGDAPTIVVPAPIAVPEQASDPADGRTDRPAARRLAPLLAIASAAVIGTVALLGSGGSAPPATPPTTGASADLVDGSTSTTAVTAAAELPRLDLDGSAVDATALGLLRFVEENELREVLLNVELVMFDDTVDEFEGGRLIAYVPASCEQFCEGNAFEILVEVPEDTSDSFMFRDSGALVLKGKFVVQSVAIQTGGIYSIALRATDIA